MDTYIFITDKGGCHIPLIPDDKEIKPFENMTKEQVIEHFLNKEKYRGKHIIRELVEKGIFERTILSKGGKSFQITSREIIKDENRTFLGNITLGKFTLFLFYFNDKKDDIIVGMKGQKGFSNVGYDDIKSIQKMVGILANKKGLIGQYSNKSVLKRLEKYAKYHEVRNSISLKEGGK